MNFLKKAFCAAALAGGFAATANAQAVSLIEVADDYKVVIKKTTTGYEVTSPDQSKIQVVPGSVEGRPGGQVFYRARIMKDGPVDLTNLVPPVQVGYEYAINVMGREAFHNLAAYSANPFSSSQVYTEPYYTEGEIADFLPLQSVESDLDTVTSEYIQIRTLAETRSLCAGCTFHFQDVQYLAAGILQEPSDEIKLIDNNDIVNPGYEAYSTNKGQFIGTWPGVSGYQWYLFGWNTGSGHYADWKLLTNGTSVTDQGLDLSEYSTIELTINCFTNQTIEVFFGTADDSSQNYLGDINCDQTKLLRLYDISGFNATDIQSALWFHIPTWKNAHVSQSQTLDMNISILNIKK